MATYTPQDFAAFNLELRTLRSRIIVYFDEENEITFDNDDMIVDWNISQALTDTINTPFDSCCADTCTLTVYNRYTGIFDGEEVVDFKIFDPLKNSAAALNIKFKVQLAALRKDNAWTPWVTVGIFYTTDIKVNDDRNTATLQGDDLLALIFGRNLPRMPVYKNVTFKTYLKRFCAKYDLTVDWEAECEDKLKYAYHKKSTKETIQGLVSSAATVATITYDDDDAEVLKVTPFTAFYDAVPYQLVDYNNTDFEDTAAQLFTLRYNKSLQRTNEWARVTWCLPSISDTSSMYQYTTTDLDDFIYDEEDKRHEMSISRANLSPAPMNCIDYTTACAPYNDEHENFGAGVTATKATQYTFTGTVKSGMDHIPDDSVFSVAVNGRYVISESQTLPEDKPEVETEAMNEYVTVDLPYVHTKKIANSRYLALNAWTSANIQVVDATLRYNPYIKLASTLNVDTRIYDIGSFTGVLWSQNITYSSGGIQSDAQLVNLATFSRGIDAYDVVGYQSLSDSSMSKIYAVGKLVDRVGLWVTPTRLAGPTNGMTFLGSLKHEVTDAAIAFDGLYIRNDNKKIFTLITEEEPWIFTVSKGKLYGQLGLKGERILLASDAVQVCAERGFFPAEFTDINTDQGLVVAYTTTDNTACYRTYVNTENGKHWMAEEIIEAFDEPIINIQAHRLNDYRFGIVVTTAEKSKWYITERTYSQMAFRPEYFTVQEPGIMDANLTCVRYDGSFEIPQASLSGSINKAKQVITITSNMSFKQHYSDVNYRKRFTLSTTVGTLEIKDIVIGENTITITLNKKATATFTISYTQSMFLAVRTSDAIIPSGGYVPLQSFSYTFEIYESTYNHEHLKLTEPRVKDIECSTFPPEVIRTYTHEHFKLGATKLSALTATTTDLRVKLTTLNDENFSISEPGLTAVTCEIIGVGIMPI
ncbi:MAG: hypothetical protein IJ421_00215 [Prevotella sp.]|nr:hypothetical protein [Prevotella sp.]